MRVERRLAIGRVDQGHDSIEPVAQHQIGMIHDRVQHRRGVGEASGLQHDAAERRDAAVVALLQQILQRGDKIAANGAADATRTHHDHVAVDFLDEQVIESDIAKFVDQHERVGEFRRGQQTIEQRRLAGAQESRQHGKRQRRRRTPRGPAFDLGRVLIAHWPASRAGARAARVAGFVGAANVAGLAGVGLALWLLFGMFRRGLARLGRMRGGVFLMRLGFGFLVRLFRFERGRLYFALGLGGVGFRRRRRLARLGRRHPGVLGVPGVLFGGGAQRLGVRRGLGDREASAPSFSPV